MNGVAKAQSEEMCEGTGARRPAPARQGERVKRAGGNGECSEPWGGDGEAGGGKVRVASRGIGMGGREGAVSHVGAE